VQDFAHFLGAEEEVLAAVIAHEEPEAVGVALHAPADEIQLFHHADRIPAVADDLAVALHRGEPARNALELALRHLQ
jgi:hypothetical protein